MSHMTEVYRKEQEALHRVITKVSLANSKLLNASVNIEYLINGVADEKKEEGDVAATLTEAYAELDMALKQLSHIASQAWEAKSPNHTLFSEEIAAWQRTHPPEEWYSQDYKKHIEKL